MSQYLRNMQRYINNDMVDEFRSAILSGIVPVNTLDNFGNSLLHKAVNAKRYTMVQLLLSLGIDRTIQNTLAGNTAMHIACAKGFISIVRLMTSKGIEDFEIDNLDDERPLQLAIEGNHIPIARFLINNGAGFYYLSQTTVNEITETRASRERRILEEIRRRHLREGIQVRSRIGQELRQGFFERRAAERLLRAERLRHAREEREMIQEQNEPEVEKKEVLRPSKDILELIIKNEIEKKTLCPIGLDEIMSESAVVTNCFHVFTRENIEHWLEVSESCPVCKAKCFVL